MKRYLEDKHIHEKKNNDEEKDKPRSSEACKWDKTDSECEFIYIIILIWEQIAI